MKTVKLHMIIALGALFGVFATQKTSSPAPSECNFFEMNRFKASQNQQVINYFKAVCSATNNGNDKIQRLIWRALVEKQDKALEVLIDMIQKSKKNTQEMASCLNGAGEERCLAKTVSAAVLGLIGNFFKNDACFDKKYYLSCIKKKEDRLKEVNKLINGEKKKELIQKLDILNAQNQFDNPNKLTIDQLIKETEAQLEILPDTNLPSIHYETNHEKIGLKIDLDQIKANEQKATIKMIAWAVVTVAAGALALEGGVRYYQSRQEQNRWEAFKKTDNYQEVLAEQFNNFVDQYLPELNATNNAIENFLAKNNQNSLLKASLRWVIENLNKGSWLVSKEEIQTIFNCIITRKEDNACDLPTSWGTGRFKQEFNYDAYMQPKYQAQVMRFILDGKSNVIQKAEVETCPE